MSELINGLTKAEYEFMFRDPIYPEDYYDEVDELTEEPSDERMD